MAFKTVLTPGVDKPIQPDEYKCMELYLVSKRHRKRRRQWQEDPLNSPKK